MSDLGKYWAGAPAVTENPLNKNAESGVFHRIDIAGVASSILATPTIEAHGDGGFFVGVGRAGWLARGSHLMTDLIAADCGIRQLYARFTDAVWRQTPPSSPAA